MQITLIRTDLMSDKTFGLLDIDGGFECHTVEDQDLKLEEDPTRKVYGKTAIPRGKYTVVLDFSMRFKKVLPHVLGVPGFDGIRIHTGNTAEDSFGCILVGYERDARGIKPGTSRPAMATLMQKLIQATEQKEPITLEIK